MNKNARIALALAAAVSSVAIVNCATSTASAPPDSTTESAPADGDSGAASVERPMGEAQLQVPTDAVAATDAPPPPPVTTAMPTTPPMTMPSLADPSPKKAPPVRREPSAEKTKENRSRIEFDDRLIDGKLGAKDSKPADEAEEVARKNDDKGGTFVHAGTNPFIDTQTDALSTFAIDVDTGSFSFARRYLKAGTLPPDGAVRVEEWVNAMHYAYAPPPKTQEVPFSVLVAGAPSPISKGKTVVRVALQGKEVSRAERKPTNLVFLVDVSGSMSDPDKLPLAKDALRMLVNQLREDDSVALVTYAGNTSIVLPTTSASNKAVIMKGIDSLSSSGGTNMSSGMELAYREATKGLGGGRSARVMVLSDGDANIGKTSHDDILKSIRGYVSEGVMMSTVGFGTGNYNDHLMEQLADAGNGNYSYIDSMKTAEKVFVAGLEGNLEVIAQDVKIQVEWNKDVVTRYRLLGYENRDVADRDFRNDKKDAGEIGAGHAVTALYEVELASTASPSQNLGTVRVRAKKPRGTKADELAVAITPSMMSDSAMKLDNDAIAASATALAAEILRGSPYAEGRTLSEAAELLMGAAVGKYADERKELAKELLAVEPHLAHR